MAIKEYTNRTILSDSVGNLCRIDPQSEFVGENGSQVFGIDATGQTCPGENGVHLVVDADTAVTRALGWSVWEPMMLVMVFQAGFDGLLELIQLVCSQDVGVHP